MADDVPCCGTTQASESSACHGDRLPALMFSTVGKDAPAKSARPKASELQSMKPASVQTRLRPKRSQCGPSGTPVMA